MHKVYLDWGIRKPHTIIIDGGEPKEVTTEELLFLPPSEIYLETGCPRSLLYSLAGKGHKLFQIDGRFIKKLRGKNRKSDELDVQLIKKAPEEFPQKFRVVTPRDVFLLMKMRMYDRLTKMCAALKNYRQSFIREFGDNKTLEVIDKAIESLEKERNKKLAEIRPHISRELTLVKHIKGIDLRYLAALLIYAHPSKFESVKRFLSYCGYRGLCKHSNRYSRRVKHIAHQIAMQLVRHKDNRYYPIYAEIKENLSKKHPDYSEKRIKNMAINRLATYFLKDFYKMFHRRKVLRPNRLFHLPSSGGLPLLSTSDPAKVKTYKYFRLVKGD